MIEKMLGLSNLGVLQGAIPSGGVDLGKCTVIYGENGRGKTTLARLIASLGTDDCSCLRPLSAISSAGEPSASLLVSRSQYSLRGYSWSPQGLATVLVFDTDFVMRSVFTGTSVEPEHRKNLCRFAVGEEGVSLTNAVERINREIREITTQIGELERELKATVGRAMSVDEFLGLSQDAEIEQKIAAAIRTVDAARDGETIRTGKALEHASLPSGPSHEQMSILTSTVEDIATDAVERTRTHIQSRLGPGGEEWLRLGMGYMAEERCPFCDQDASTSELIKAFRGYFSEAYDGLRREVGEAAAKTEAQSSELELQRMRALVAANDAAAEFWKKYTSLPPLQSPCTEVEGAVAAVRSHLLPAFQQKKADLLRPVEPGRPPDEFLRLAEVAEGSVASYNFAVDAANEMIEECRTQVLKRSLADAESSLARLRLQKARWEPEASGRCSTLTELRLKKTKQEKSKDDAKQRLDRHMRQMMGSYQSGVNAFLEKCNAAFRIVQMDLGFAGGEPRADYAIELFGRSVGVSTRDTKGPHFDTMLSDGDRRTLALAFFLAKLEADPAIANRIVVLDDPISSLDIHRASHVVEESVAVSKRCRQLIVLTHDPLFAMELCDTLSGAGASSDGDLCVLELARAGQCTTIRKCDPAGLYQTLLERSIRTLRAFTDGPAEVAAVDAVKSIRPAIEGLLRLKYPKDFHGALEFGSLVARIRDAEEASRLHRLKDEIDEFYAVCSYYATSYMHVDRPYSTAAPSDADALSWVKRALRLLDVI